MFYPNPIDRLVTKLCATLPSRFRDIESDVHDTFQSILQAGFAELDLVTREEFDAQVKVLARTREKVEALAKQLEQLELSHPKR
jgi:ubiquinone biosynthesis accessory factor UbiK